MGLCQDLVLIYCENVHPESLSYKVCKDLEWMIHYHDFVNCFKQFIQTHNFMVSESFVNTESKYIMQNLFSYIIRKFH